MKKYWEEIKYHMARQEIQIFIEYRPGFYQGLYITDGSVRKEKNSRAVEQETIRKSLDA